MAIHRLFKIVAFAVMSITFSGYSQSEAVLINEIEADTIGVDELEFVELYDGGGGNTVLDGLVVVFYNGNGEISYASFDLDGYSTDANGYFLLGNPLVPGADLIFPNGTLQNGADAVALYQDDASNFPDETPVTTTNLMDAVVYGTGDATDEGLLVLLNPDELQLDEDGNTNKNYESLQRIPDGSGGTRNTSRFFACTPTPDAANQCDTYDADQDGLLDVEDNCPSIPNGPVRGICINGILGATCVSSEECVPDGFCSMNQEDSDLDGVGDACDDDTMCKGNFDYDTDVDGTDAFVFKSHFGRSAFKNPCQLDGPVSVAKTGSNGPSGPLSGDDRNWIAGVRWPNPRFTDNENGTVTDNLTGLIWLKENNCFGLRTRIQALSDANGLAEGACGLTDGSIAGNWRLPNIKELLSLIDYSHFFPPLSHPHPFENIQPANYWSSTIAAYNDYPWCVNMYTGESVSCGGTVTDSWYGWPVRGGQVQMRFIDNENGTVTDKNTGLIWLKDASCLGRMNWLDAIDAAANLASGQCGLTDGSVAGDWRLPTKESWEAFVCIEFTNPAVCNTSGRSQWQEGNPFSNVQPDFHWSGTELDSDNAYGMFISDGGETFGHKSGSDGFVWPTRDP